MGTSNESISRPRLVNTARQRTILQQYGIPKWCREGGLWHIYAPTTPPTVLTATGATTRHVSFMTHTGSSLSHLGYAGNWQKEKRKADGYYRCSKIWLTIGKRKVDEPPRDARVQTKRFVPSFRHSCNWDFLGLWWFQSTDPESSTLFTGASTRSKVIHTSEGMRDESTTVVNALSYCFWTVLHLVRNILLVLLQLTKRTNSSWRF